MQDNIPSAAEVQVHDHTKQTDRTREVFVPVPVNNSGGTDFGATVLDPGIEELADYLLKVPGDFVSFTSVQIIYHPTSANAGDVDMDFTAYWGVVG